VIRPVLVSGAVAAGGVLAVHALPAATFQPTLRRAVWPALAGLGDPGHVALTFDDGPHPRSTPFFLDALSRHGVRATFFLLGTELARCPRLGQEIVAAGHEVAVHGWQHRRLLRYGPGRTRDELTRARDLIATTTGRSPRWFRPPYGVLTTSALRTARRLDLTPVLWSCWGWDWTARATPTSVTNSVRRGLTGGGTILLHDSDAAAAVGSWRATLGALPRLLDLCAERGWSVGPLREHGLDAGQARLSAASSARRRRTNTTAPITSSTTTTAAIT
jgi:peptidoglycan/xylan/chitin deacetylase (PgdA/CDA1 family)